MNDAINCQTTRQQSVSKVNNIHKNDIEQPDTHFCSQPVFFVSCWQCLDSLSSFVYSQAIIRL